MWVVKLGGSLMQAPELKSWLDMLVAQEHFACIIVPGGGMFADAVRAAQRTGGFDDATAHRMAVLAMEQFAWLLQSLCPALTIAGAKDEILDAARRPGATLWMPSRMVLDDPAIPANWQVTSDSLAAWLAGQLDAEGLVLVKHADFSGQRADIPALQAQGILDAAFAEFSGRLACPVHVIGKSSHHHFRQLLDGAALPALNLAKEIPS
ncbi:MAG: hypothetical protein FGM62_04375 [Methylobacterium sp.]|nr:hypothetical protein [Methylobacterium sp.]